MSKRRRRGLSFGSILMVLMTVAAILGTYYFLTKIASDSPAAAMNIPEIVSAVEDAFHAPATATPTHTVLVVLTTTP